MQDYLMTLLGISGSIPCNRLFSRGLSDCGFKQAAPSTRRYGRLIGRIT